jgi:methionine synthase II (cobalamin-independent)
MTLPSSTQLPLMRVDQVESLLRPANLKEMFIKHGRGDASDEQLRQAQDEAIRAVIAYRSKRPRSPGSRSDQEGLC